MNRLAVAALAFFGVLAPLCALADDAQQTNTFSDPAMSYTAPDGFKRMTVPPHDPAQFEDKTVVAAYVKGTGQDVRAITLTMENFDGDVKAFQTEADNDIRNNSDGVFIKSSEATLSNGMPAIFEEVTVGSGFDQIMQYRYLWADGVRGVVLSEMARYGQIDAKTAQADLRSASAVAYPKYRY